MRIARTLLETAGRTVFGVIIVAVMLLALVVINGPAAVAQQFMSVFVSGGAGASGATGRPYGVPAYLRSVHITDDSTTIVKSSPGVIGCVVVNSASVGGTATLYNSVNAAVAGYELAVIDTTAKQMFCYGMIFSGGLAVVTTSSGTDADLTITYR